MVTKFPITPESISHTDIKLMIRNNYTKYPKRRRRYEFFCSYDLFWEEQHYFNKLIQDIVAEFGMSYLVVPKIGENLEKQIVIIFDTSNSLFDDTFNLIHGATLKMESDLEEINKQLEASIITLQSHGENQKKEINLLLKQKDKLEKKLEECKNHQVDMLTYRDDIIGKITLEKNELENANKSQLRYINEMEANMKKGNEEYKKLKDKYDRLCYDYDVLEEKRNKLSRNYEILKDKHEDKKRLINSVYGFKQRDLEKVNNYYRDKVHELFDMLLTVEFRQKEKEKEKKEEKKMTEEQRYRERIQIEKDKIILLKRIAEALEIIAAPHVRQKYEMDMSEVKRVEDMSEIKPNKDLEALNKIFI